MIRLTQETKILVAIQPVDFRKQIDGLVLLCKKRYQQDPRSGLLFVFVNRSKTTMRFLHYDGTGYWLASKRLSQGRYQGWPASEAAMTPLVAEKLMKIIKPNT